MELKFLKDPKKVYGGAETIHTVVKQGLKGTRPELYRFLDAFHWTVDEMNSVIVANHKKDDPKGNAKAFVAAHPKLVDAWVAAAEGKAPAKDAAPGAPAPPLRAPPPGRAASDGRGTEGCRAHSRPRLRRPRGGTGGRGCHNGIEAGRGNDARGQDPNRRGDGEEGRRQGHAPGRNATAGNAAAPAPPPKVKKVEQVEKVVGADHPEHGKHHASHVKHAEEHAKKAKKAKKWVPHLKVGGTLRWNYFVKSWAGQDANRMKLGDIALDTFRINVSGDYGPLKLSGEYRFYAGYSMLHHGWMGYQAGPWMFTFGLQRQPFGLLPYASHSWFFDLGYYLGLEDTYALGLSAHYHKGHLDAWIAGYKNSGGSYTGSSVDSARYSYDLVHASAAEVGNAPGWMNRQTTWSTRPAAGSPTTSSTPTATPPWRSPPATAGSTTPPPRGWAASTPSPGA